MAASDHGAPLVKRLARLSVAAATAGVAPANPPWWRRRGRRDGNTFLDNLKLMLLPGSSRCSTRPLLSAAAFMLRHWLAPYVVLLVPLLFAWRAGQPHTLELEAAWPSIAFFLLWLCALVHCFFFDWQLRRSLWDAGSVRPGVYVPEGSSSLIGERLRALHASFRITRWAWNGDMQTLVPYIFHAPPLVAYTRLWLEAPAVGDRGNDAAQKREVLAHDWAFPEGGHDAAQPIAIVLHGLNGGSAEPLVMDFVSAATARGWTCVVLNARGLGGTELSSAYPFHGARTSDLCALVDLVAEAAPGVELVGVGYSMGAIILANYVGVSGTHCKLSAAVAISGCMDAVANKGGYSSRSLEPFLTYELKQNFCTGPCSTLLAKGGVDLSAAIGPRVGCIMEFDAATVVPFNGFDDVDDYYRHMTLGHLGKERRVTVPLLHLHACDDPIIDCDTFAPYLSGGVPLPPNLYFLITRHGGHVGWSEGWMPWRKRWAFQNRAVFEFLEAVHCAPEPPPTGQRTPGRQQRAARSPSRSGGGPRRR